MLSIFYLRVSCMPSLRSIFGYRDRTSMEIKIGFFFSISGKLRILFILLLLHIKCFFYYVAEESYDMLKLWHANRTWIYYITYGSKCWNGLKGFMGFGFCIKIWSLSTLYHIYFCDKFFMEKVLNFFSEFLFIWTIWSFIQCFIIVCIHKYTQTCLVIFLFV